MTFNYVALQATATRLIAQFGRPVTLHRLQDVAPADPTKPWVPGTPVDVTYPAQAVVFPVETQFVDDTVLSTDEQAYVSGALVPVDVSPKDYLVDGATRYAIVKAVSVAPGGTSVLWTLFLRV